jgi:DNA repair exonuclease SbcCD nuclease subunit
MALFRFLHAADLHIDSPLIGLARKSKDFASRIDDASRRAFDNLIALAVEEECEFVVIAGDLFDGQWRDYRTGLYFVDRMRRLRDARIRVYLILGNHDAENRFVSRLEYAENVRVFSHRKPETVPVEGLDAVIHGRSFPQRDVSENIAQDYPAPVSGCFNIGLLHTACTGRDGHALYAPCTIEQLVNHGYDYWALGHVHAREVVQEHPCIIYPGSLQGRNPRETGPKGATLVTVDDGRVVGLENRALDVIRWSVESIDVGACTDIPSVHAVVREQIEQSKDAATGRGLALRLRLVGRTPIHNEIIRAGDRLREEIETMVAMISDEIWIEKIEIKTSPLLSREATDPTVAGRLRLIVEQFSSDSAFMDLLEKKLGEVSAKVPDAAHADELFSAIRAEGPARAVTLALSLIESGQE